MIAAPTSPKQRFWETTVHCLGLGSQEVAPRSRQRRLGTGTAEFAGETHVGYGKLDFPAQFNCGGQSSVQLGGEVWKMPILSRAVGVTNFEESTVQIVAAAKSAAYETLIF